MNKTVTYISLACIAIALLLASCKKEEEETIPKGIVYVSNQIHPINEFNFQVVNDQTEKTVTLTGDTLYKFTVRITMPATENLTVKLDARPEMVEEYNKANDTKYSFLPDGFLQMEKSEVVIPKGNTESNDSIIVKLNQEAKWGDLTGGNVLIPMKIVSVNGKAENISTKMSMVVSFGELVIILDNVTYSEEAIPGEAFNDNLTLTSDYSVNRLKYLTDKNETGSSWYPGSNPASYLHIEMENEETIKGIKVNTVTGTYQLKSLRIQTWDEEYSRFIIQGIYTADAPTPTQYIKFKEPVKTKAIKLDQFNQTLGNKQPDLTEINLIK
ncbi:DUF1735 domain-containing protein [Proteiniphilum sp. X52]|uniref:DUF1735 domain-containing protein n=1 Tax=Proteiniphilum sp. X52 TaxID=2382159 RepID=UPI000F0A80CB|nr:DUF1735 domain-containing protein [Proteiniphilum sp. X52]RNC64317.1 DUF1735 domain-containing protein [Proteiniphilum sp. X52]